MATNETASFTDTTSSDAIQSIFDRILLIRGTYHLIHNMPMKKKPLAQRNGKTIIFRRYDTLALATTALTEGMNPSGRAKTRTDISALIAIYGDFIEDTNLLITSQPEAVKAENVELLGQQMGETIDQIDRDLYATATQTVFSNGSALNGVTSVPDRNDTDRLHRLMKNNKAKEFVPMIMSSQKIGASSIMPSSPPLVYSFIRAFSLNLDGL